MSAPFDAGARALFEDTMAGRFETALKRPDWEEVDEEERAGWRATVKAIVEAEQGGELERLRTDLRNVQQNTAAYRQEARAEVVEANKRAAEATRRADATAEANRRLLTAFENPAPATDQAGEVALREACERLLLAMTTRALRGRDHVPSMRDEQDAASALRAALATQPATSQEDKAVAWCSAGQLAMLMESDSDGGTYLPIRKTKRGNFTMPLFAATPTPPAAEGLQELVAMLEASTLEDGVRVYEHDAEEIGIATMDCGAALLAALAGASEVKR